MLKEQKAQLKELDKSVSKTFRTIAKKFGYKVISNSLYKKVDNFFIDAVFFIHYEENSFHLQLRMSIKSYLSDDLFWTIFNMEDNINAKESLRANGAFVAPSFRFKESSIVIEKAEDIERICKIALESLESESTLVLKSVKFNVDDFNRFILEQSNLLDEQLIKALAEIQLGNFIAAINICEKELNLGNSGGFENEGKDIYEYIINYCLDNQIMIK